MLGSGSLRVTLSLVLLTALSGCATAGTHPPASQAIPRILGQQADAWNTGDIGAFMRPYLPSADLTFSSGGRVTRGYERVLENYRQRYPGRAAMGRLTFSDLEINELGPDAAFVLGRWRLERDEPVGGTFTLVLRRIDDGWYIVHDHTSRNTE